LAAKFSPKPRGQSTKNRKVHNDLGVISPAIKAAFINNLIQWAEDVTILPAVDTTVEHAVGDRFRLLSPWLNERSLRLWAGTEAKVFGWGGVRAVARASGLAINTVRRGFAEVAGEAIVSDPLRIRRAGGGRKTLTQSQPELLAALERLVSSATRGDPMRPLLWTCKSVRRLSGELVKQGHQISPAKTADLLHELGYSLQSHRKRDEGKSHPDRDAQFNHITEQVLAFQKAGSR
jgi:transposase